MWLEVISPDIPDCLARPKNDCRTSVSEAVNERSKKKLSPSHISLKNGFKNFFYKISFQQRAVWAKSHLMMRMT